MIDLSEVAIIPREDLIELQAAAYDPNSATFGNRMATTVQTTLVCAVVAGAVTLGGWGYYKARDWFEEKSFKRQDEANKQGWKFKTSTSL